MAGPTLAVFFEDWWRLHAEPNLEPATLRLYRGMWTRHALPRLGQVDVEELSPLMLVKFRADLEADGVGPEAIRKTLSMLQGLLQRAVEWQLVESNAARVVRKPPSARLRAVAPIGPEAVEAMRRELLARGRKRDAVLLVLLAYAGLRPQEALALEWRHVRERTLLAEQAVSDGRVKGLKNRRRPRAVDLLEPLRCDLASWRSSCGGELVMPSGSGGFWRDTDWRNWRRRVFKPPRPWPALKRHARTTCVTRSRPFSSTGPLVGRRDRRPARAYADGLPRHLRARAGRAARGAGRERGGADPDGSREPLSWLE